MNISSYGHFVAKDGPAGRVRESADGLNWYTLTRAMIQWDDIGRFVSSSTGELFVLVQHGDGHVAGVDKDASKLPPEDHDLYGVPPETAIEVGMIYQNGAFLPKPVPPVVIPDVSRRQLAQVLAVDGLITEGEAFAWAANGVIPAQLSNAIDGLPANQRFPARMALGGTAFARAHPLTAFVAAIFGRTDADLDDIWQRGAAL